MSDNPIYLNPNSNITYGDVVKVGDAQYIKTEHGVGTMTHMLSTFQVCDDLSADGACCSSGTTTTREIDTSHVDTQDMIHINPDDAVAVGDKILFEDRCYAKTGDTGLMTHTLTGMPSDLIFDPTAPTILGDMYGAGLYNDGQLGISTTSTFDTQLTFTQLPNTSDIIDASVSYEMVMYVKADGTLWYAGDSPDSSYQNTTTFTQIGTDTDWEKVFVGQGTQSCFWAIKTDGTLWFQGRNHVGKSGTGIDEGNDGTWLWIDVPTQVGVDNDWKDVHNNVSGTFFLKNNGHVYGAGSNGRNALLLDPAWTAGNSLDYENTGQTGKLDGLPKRETTNGTWRKVRWTHHTSVWMDTNNKLYGHTNQGSNYSYQFGVYPAVNSGQLQEIPITDAKDFECGQYSLVVLKNDDTLWYVGEWRWETAGSSASITNPNVTFAFEKIADNVVSFAVGKNNIWYIDNTGRMFARGENPTGSLGLGTTTNTTNFTQVGTDTDWSHVQADKKGYIAIAFKQ